MHRKATTVGEVLVAVLIIGILIGCAVLIGCAISSHRSSVEKEQQNRDAWLVGQGSPDGGRFTVQACGVFQCQTQDRESRRAIYVITDTQTGVAYLAVQGCGTSQLVTETEGSGKNKKTVTVER